MPPPSRCAPLSAENDEPLGTELITICRGKSVLSSVALNRSGANGSPTVAHATDAFGETKRGWTFV